MKRQSVARKIKLLMFLSTFNYFKISTNGLFYTINLSTFVNRSKSFLVKVCWYFFLISVGSATFTEKLASVIKCKECRN